ncbi:anhydro-N-acetylmuramic acid kinase [Pedobacter sp. SYSU D00535]|uniref:anhydro-N-acetylmuramic acid kinase n=1 Tax=Pedobacter sp. SYSU D00535 TaxID=2810308 RepID=UPI001A96AF8F|nr:anhydro-N-acetylmuramic acid kinase [Pedobacter sp. SYSU D00535]
MNSWLTRLSKAAELDSRLIVGLMSGTSLDGLDVALCRIKGSGLATHLELLGFETLPYEEKFKDDVRQVFSKREIDLEKLTLLNAYVGRMHGELVLTCLSRWRVVPSSVTCIASHGQTVYHAPQRIHRQAGYPDATLQIGDGDHLSVSTGIPVLSDFRQKHVAAGGEGAPLALYGDTILFSSDEEDRVLLNIGGISNFTYLPRTQQKGPIICTDAGPGNTLIDALTKKLFDKPYDADGTIASSGTVIVELLQALMDHRFFSEPLPKTTGPELFNLQYLEAAQLKARGSNASPTDLIATVTEFTVQGIVRTLRQGIPGQQYGLYASGGGAHNRFLLKRLSESLGLEVRKTEVLGLGGDAKEAVLFAILANETLCGSAIATGAGPQLMMGKISLPG